MVQLCFINGTECQTFKAGLRMSKAKLTAKQEELFKLITSPLRQETAVSYIAGGYSNGTAAYLAACKKLKKKPSKNPETSASEILSYPNVTDFIDSIKLVAAQDVRIDAAWVLKQAVEVHHRCMTAVKVKTRSGEPVFDDDGNPVYSFEHSGANKALEIIGKHVDVQAFNDKLTVESEIIVRTTLDDFYG